MIDRFTGSFALISRQGSTVGWGLPPSVQARQSLFLRPASGTIRCHLHFDETRAVEPLERTAAWETVEVPETYPSML